MALEKISKYLLEETFQKYFLFIFLKLEFFWIILRSSNQTCCPNDRPMNYVALYSVAHRARTVHKNQLTSWQHCFRIILKFLYAEADRENEWNEMEWNRTRRETALSNTQTNKKNNPGQKNYNGLSIENLYEHSNRLEYVIRASAYNATSDSHSHTHKLYWKREYDTINRHRASIVVSFHFPHTSHRLYSVWHTLHHKYISV